MIEYIPLILFALVFILILFGYPVALVLGGISVVSGLLFFDIDFFYLVSLRIFGIMNNFVLLAVPLFIFMGMTLERSGIAEKLLETMAILFGKIKGGLAYSVIIVGGMLAASTGIVGATVVTMGLISLPVMIKRGYNTKLATGVIASSGTLGQIIPPSVVLVLLGSVLNISVGDLFTSALLPGLTLVILYLIYVLIISIIYPEFAPSMPNKLIKKFKNETGIVEIIKAFILPFVLIFAVLGSIFAGIASPTEAAGIGAFGALILSYFQANMNLKKLKIIMKETTSLTSIVFMILIGATFFSLVFRGLDGEAFIHNLLLVDANDKNFSLIIVLLLMFFLGFILDFIEIIFIIIPLFGPALFSLGFEPIWIGILIAMVLQTSFLTPPFGFALFYLRGVAPKNIPTFEIYKGVYPFVMIQILVIVIIFLYPEIATFLPNKLSN